MTTADPPAGVRAEADRLFREGQASEGARDWRRALECYRRAIALVDDPAIGAALAALMRRVGPM